MGKNKLNFYCAIKTIKLKHNKDKNEPLGFINNSTKNTEINVIFCTV